MCFSLLGAFLWFGRLGLRLWGVLDVSLICALDRVVDDASFVQPNIAGVVGASDEGRVGVIVFFADAVFAEILTKVS